jgi:hypothetical protein
MSLSTTIVVDDASGDDVTYNRMGGDTTSSTFIDVTSDTAEKGLITIKHQTQGTGAAKIDRHLISLVRTVAAVPAPVSLTCNLTIACPQNAAVTSQMIYDGVANLIDFVSAGGLATLTTTTIDSLLRNET